MRLKISFDPSAWEHYLYWQNTDRGLLRRLNRLLEEIQRTPYEGTGKPKPLKHDYAGCWSRRITDGHRLIYRIEGDVVFILQCRYHY